MLDFDKKSIEHQITTADMKVIRMIRGVTRWGRNRNEDLYKQSNMKVIRMIQGVTRWDRNRNEDLYKQSNMLLIVQVINNNKLRWFGHVVRREEESMLRVVMKLKMKGKRQRGRPRLSYPPGRKEHVER